MNDIEERFGAEPACIMGPDGSVGILRVLLIDFDRLPATAGSGGVGHQLRTAAFLQAHKPEDSLFDRVAYRQEPVVLQEGCLLISECGGNILPFLFRKDDAIKLLVDNVVLEDWDDFLSMRTPPDGWADGRQIWILLTS